MRKALGTIAITGALILAPAAIASADTAPAPASDTAVSNPVNVDDNSDKTGLWGLLGLAGLAGLMRRKSDTEHSSTYTSNDVRR